ncbi:hypothetical protein [Actinomadura sp. 21ATH]|uniref:hypothetical protein n=1 Tax=Actinomadura sp. 21ATH TaxID=1735444 RepID=UPI0035BF8DA1
MEVFAVMTLSVTHPSGDVETLTLTKAVPIPATVTREAVFKAMYAGAPERFREQRATVLFFSVEPNRIEAS